MATRTPDLYRVKVALSGQLIDFIAGFDRSRGSKTTVPALIAAISQRAVSLDKFVLLRFRRGSPAVLVTEEGKVYKIANQDKVTAHAGHKVTISGTIDGDTIKAESVKM